MGFFKNRDVIKYFILERPNIIEEAEEFPLRLECDYSEELLTKEDEPLKAFEIDEWYKAFIDGTYRVVRLGTFSGIPLYFSSITAILAMRDYETKRLEIYGPVKNLLVLSFPFDAFIQQRLPGYEKIREFKEFLKTEYKALEEYVFRLPDNGELGALKILLDRNESELFVISDITYRGFEYFRRNSLSQFVQVDHRNIFDEGFIFKRVKSKIRVLMSILESANLKFFRDLVEGVVDLSRRNWVLIDGTLNNYQKFFFAGSNQSAYYKYFDNTVGFIKTIRRQPKMNMRKLYTLDENEFQIVVSTKTDTDEHLVQEMDEQELEAENTWGFVYLRFRFPNYYRRFYSRKSYITKGLIKLQFRATGLNKEQIKEKGSIIAGLTIKERYPLPTDKYRVWKETVAIEETEKLAKSMLKSKEWLIYKGQNL